ncbi:hypothetical protein D1872_333980 [compost metagenome]
MQLAEHPFKLVQFFFIHQVALIQNQDIASFYLVNQQIDDIPGILFPRSLPPIQQSFP